MEIWDPAAAPKMESMMVWLVACQRCRAYRCEPVRWCIRQWTAPTGYNSAKNPLELAHGGARPCDISRILQVSNGLVIVFFSRYTVMTGFMEWTSYCVEEVVRFLLPVSLEVNERTRMTRAPTHLLLPSLKIGIT
ncbi:hypothetical protein COOONC_11877 [Cooperia oncophora]